MNKVNVSLILNGVLIIAMAVLYYLHFSFVNSNVVPIPKSEGVTKNSIVLPDSKIAYINFDTLLVEFDMYHDLKKNLEKKQRQLENELQQKAEAFRKKQQDFVEKAQKGLLTRSEQHSQEEKLRAEQDELMKLREEMQYQLADEEQVTQRKIIYAITDYVKEFNRATNYQLILGNALFAADSLDITKAVLKGINDRYKISLKEKK